MFSLLLDSLKEKVTIVVCRTVIQANTQEAIQQAQEKQQNVKMKEVHEEPQDLVEKKSETKITSRKKNNPQRWGNISRNDLCPCGSGKKFKRCCGKDLE